MKTLVKYALVSLTIATILISYGDAQGKDTSCQTLVEQAKILERSCAFVLSTNGAPIGTGFFVEQNIPEPGVRPCQPPWRDLAVGIADAEAAIHQPRHLWALPIRDTHRRGRRTHLRDDA